ncbi:MULTISPECIES: hypothetical protein [Pseudoalteromonas]|uniref:Uncharacterized protein n=1 Tax=Pseudoalteromonas viridis TaxID=339617 RepID=A0ABX7UZD1_9GAMM|nr:MULTISPECIES: hypothetical protein [Pseudoalteromonas]MCG7535369.1 hypothetical protein [Pseudoalteromonas sp. OOF1S-7]MCO7188303.1 hypothetical protein [Pseudoalteromonas sp. XMcav2-N]QTL33879.1 hypothetical protein J5X90_09635 [Pseudoalteromonas viridis]
MKKVIAATALVLMSTSSYARTSICKTTATGVEINRYGEVQFNTSSFGTSKPVCNVSQQLGYITTETCKVMYSQMLAAVMAQSTITLWFETTETCAQLQEVYKSGWTSYQTHGFKHFRISN